MQSKPVPNFKNESSFTPEEEKEEKEEEEGYKILKAILVKGKLFPVRGPPLYHSTGWLEWITTTTTIA